MSLRRKRLFSKPWWRRCLSRTMLAGIVVYFGAVDGVKRLIGSER